MKHCADCKFMDLSKPHAEEEVRCLHLLSKRGEPSLVLKRQEYNTCYFMRRSGDCGLDAILFEPRKGLIVWRGNR